MYANWMKDFDLNMTKEDIEKYEENKKINECRILQIT